LVFNETSKKNKVVPHAGASYYLTRMPGEFGTFLALTGTPFTGSEAKELLGLADFIWNPNENFMRAFNRKLALIDFPTTAIDVFETDGIHSSVNRYKYEAFMRKLSEKKDHDIKYLQLPLDKFDPTSREKQTYTEEVNDMIDMDYKNLLRENLEHKILHDATKLGSGTTGHYLNQFKHVADVIKSFIQFETPDLTGSFLSKYETVINRCFYSNTLEEIIENLKKENSQFSKYCLKKFEENDTTALNVTLALLRKAQKSSYSECCHLEMKAMLNLLKNEHNVTEATPMTVDLIEEYFKTPIEYKNVDLIAKHHAPLPTRHYYEKYADHMRLLMNEHNSTMLGIRNGYKREVQNELREQGIDIRDHGLTTQIIRTSLWNKEFSELTKRHQEKIQGYLLKDDKMSENYYSEVAEHIETLSNENQKWSEKHKDYYELVNDLIYKCYVDAFMKNIEMMLEKNRDIHKVKKKRFFQKLKRFFFENRLLTNENKKNLIDGLRASNLPKVPLILSNDIFKNNFESFLEKNIQSKYYSIYSISEGGFGQPAETYREHLDEKFEGS
jgi:hypothetical protein